MASILIIDDIPSVAQSLDFYLQSIGYTVLTASNGKTGLQLAAARNPDLILLDLEMPVMGGVAVCKALKADPVLRLLPVIMMTGQATQEVRNQGLAAGAVVVLSKPFDLENLQATIARSLPANAGTG
jgi:CheY-like chemotaxis protein